MIPLIIPSVERSQQTDLGDRIDLVLDLKIHVRSYPKSKKPMVATVEIDHESFLPDMPAYCGIAMMKSGEGLLPVLLGWIQYGMRQ